MPRIIDADTLKIYTRETIAKWISMRAGETKFGEEISFVTSLDALKNHAAQYVLIGIPEDIGVRANYGRPGTSEAWRAGLSAFLNIQKNHFLNPENVILLGEINCDEVMRLAAEIQDKAIELGQFVNQIDEKVSAVIQAIVEAGKIPIVIGGGHNNSYGNIKGTSEGLGKAINCINFDAHTDFRALEHRHSGNGFSYAFNQDFLDKYFIFGLHRNYTSEAVFSEMQKHANRVAYNLFETIAIDKTQSFTEALQEAENHCCEADFGIELDMDSIELMGSSAMTSSGFSMSEARAFLAYFSKHPHLKYIHICEGAPKYGVFENQVGKAIAYLVSDVIAED